MLPWELELERRKYKGPLFKDYRCTNDGVMVADIGFKRQLWALDPELDVVWDWGKAKWEIWKFPGQSRRVLKKMDEKAYHVMTVQTADRSFRELGADVLLRLQWGNWDHWTLNELCDYFDQADANARRAKEKKLRNWIEAVALDTFDYARAVPKGQVPFSYKVKPSEEKLLIKVKQPRPNVAIFQPTRSAKIASVVGGSYG